MRAICMRNVHSVELFYHVAHFTYNVSKTIWNAFIIFNTYTTYAQNNKNGCSKRCIWLLWNYVFKSNRTFSKIDPRDISQISIFSICQLAILQTYVHLVAAIAFLSSFWRFYQYGISHASFFFIPLNTTILSFPRLSWHFVYAPTRVVHYRSFYIEYS